MKRDWLWDRRIPIFKVKKILRNPKNKRFILYASLLLSRNNNPREVFKEYLDPLLFCTYWPQIKRKMRQDKWITDRIIFWQAIYENLLDKYREKGIKFREHKDKIRDVLCRNIGENIRKIRLEKGLSQGQLAKEIGVAQQLVSRIEKGRENASLVTLQRLSMALRKEIKIKFI